MRSSALLASAALLALPLLVGSAIAACVSSSNSPPAGVDSGTLGSGDGATPGVDSGGNPGTDSGGNPGKDSGGNPGTDSGGGTDAGSDSSTTDSGGGSPCPGVALVTQNGTNLTADAGQLIASNDQSLVIYGAPIDGGYGPVTGFYRITGYTGGQSIKAQIVMAACSIDNCPTNDDFSINNYDDLFSGGTTDGGPNCGVGVFHADDAGVLTPSYAVGGTPAGNVGLQLIPQ
jgi:hypothetical protein